MKASCRKGGLITYYTTYRCNAQITAAALCVKCHVVVLLRCRRKVVVFHSLHRSVGAQSADSCVKCERLLLVGLDGWVYILHFFELGVSRSGVISNRVRKGGGGGASHIDTG